MVELTYFHHYLETIAGVHEEKLQNESQSGPICLLFPFLVMSTLYSFLFFLIFLIIGKIDLHKDSKNCKKCHADLAGPKSLEGLQIL